MAREVAGCQAWISRAFVLAGLSASLLAGCGVADGTRAPTASDDARPVIDLDGSVTMHDDAAASPFELLGPARATRGAPIAVSVAPDAASVPLEAGASPLCPTLYPAVGAPCATSGLECEYGDDPDMRCNYVLACAAGIWVDGCPSALAGTFFCGTHNLAVCPGALDDVAQGTSCGAETLDCYYPEARCACDCLRDDAMECVTTDAGLSGNVWQCDTPSLPGCPATRPRLGSPCSVVEDCPYEGNPAGQDGNDVACYFGYWMDSGGSCEVD